MANTEPLTNHEIDELPPVMTLTALLTLMFAVISGALLAAVVLPAWLPGLAASLFGAEQKAFWYLSRGSAFVAFAILWLSMALGLTITNKMARVWPGGPTAFDLHQFTSLLGLAFALFHAFILLGDQYIGYGVAQVLLPFSSDGYRPMWVGLGQVGLYLWGLVALSFYVKGVIGTQRWRFLHYFSFFVFLLALLHGITSGTDSGSLAATVLYWWAGGSLLFLTIFRLLVRARIFKPKAQTAA